MQSVSSRILTCVTVSLSYDDNDYTTGTSSFIFVIAWSFVDLSLNRWCGMEQVPVFK